MPGDPLPLPAEITGIEFDSRRVRPGNLFFAFAGAKADGRTFAAQALQNGAIAVVSDQPAPEGFEGAWIQVPHGRRALALQAGKFYGHPDRRLHLIGITGTNGKTTTSFLIDAMLTANGKTTALVGTIEYRLAGKQLPSINTTPESLELFRLFVDLENAGGSHVVMETSSHALELGRVHGMNFHTAVFTNLTRDHLDFHGTMEAYFAAKQRLFTPEEAPAPRFAVVNRDDPYGQALEFQAETEVVWYGLREGSTAQACNIRSGFDGLRFDIRYRDALYPIQSPLIGEINVYNILAAWCTGVCEGLSPEQASRGIATLTAVPGRFERVDLGQPFLVVVDYAHTDDALRNTIKVARALTSNRVITVFGCGGDRDRSKRPLMGLAAAEGSDLVVLTSDNPRSEDPLSIMNDALVGLRRRDTPHIIEPDRERAIRRAIDEAAAGDVVIVAGKGHETYQILRDRTIAFDDRETAKATLRSFGYGEKP